ncbi:unnamed protein product, partial [Vitis vinifera]
MLTSYNISEQAFREFLGCLQGVNRERERERERLILINPLNQTIIVQVLLIQTRPKIRIKTPLAPWGTISLAPRKLVVVLNVLDDAEVKQFSNPNVKNWLVHVKDAFLLIKVTKTILEEIGSKTDSDNLNKLQLELKDQLSNKKFLLVLDDIWNLKPPQGSKIVVTSRDQSVATTMRAGRTHRLGELSPQHCWRLFEKLAFQDRDSNAFLELEPIGRQIVDKCQGLPLAVKALGRLLRSKVEKGEWEDVFDSEIWHLPSGPEILPSLRLSYHHLSLPLKHCFAYCSIFPRNHEFDKEKLILLWMAEGLLHPQQGDKRRMEEIGESYFDELLAKSFFQKSIKKKSYFVMHDLIHALAQHVSEVFCAQEEDDDRVPKVSEKTRHFLYFKSDYDRMVTFKKFEAITKAKSLRTFLEVKPSQYKPWYILSKRVLQDILPKMRCLRVLSLRGYNITDLPKSIGNLKHLRYLDLSFTMIQKLPESVCYLCNLQTMILRRYMSTYGIGRLKSLQRLTYFIVGQKNGLRIGELRELSKIRGTLHISNVNNVVSVNDALQANMKDKSYLDELILNWESGWVTNGSITQHDATTDDILNSLQPHPNLKQLSITNYPGARFPNWLGDSSFHGNASFQSLETLSFEDMLNWEKWLCCGEFPRLQKLSIQECPKLTGKLPEQLPSLEELVIVECPQLLMASLTAPAIRELRMLSIIKCDSMESLLEEEILQSNIYDLKIYYCCFSRSLNKVGLPATLKSLSISNCTKLSISISEGDPTSLCSLHLWNCPNLETIELFALNLKSCWISSCSKLRSLAHTHSYIQELGLWDCPELLFQREGLPSNLRQLQFQSCNKLTPQVEWGLQRLNSLTFLGMKGGCEDMELFPKECLLPSSLTNLSIWNLPNLKSFDSRGLQRLTSLLELKIINCPELQFSTGSVLQHLIALKELRIDKCPRLQSLIEVGLQHLTSLKRLHISECPKLQYLTKQRLQDSSTLEIRSCRKLKYLTKERLPDSLSYLHVNGCPLLEQRCQFEKGEEWRYIAHIPEIVINRVLF